MPTVSSFKMKSATGGTVKGEATIGFGVGALLGFKISDHTGMQVEAIYSSLYQKFQEKEGERKVNLRYFSIPLLFSLHTNKVKAVSFGIVLGPQLGISAGSSISKSNNSNSDEDEPILSVKRGDLGFAYGAGVNFALDKNKRVRLGFGYRGVFGVLDISDDSNTTVTDSYYILEKTNITTHAAYAGLSILF